MKKTFCSAAEAIADVRAGKMLIIVDSPKRENEADLYVTGSSVTPGAIRTMIQKGGGIVCAAMSQEIAVRLHIPLMVSRVENKEKTGVNFTVSINAKRGITTGVSAHDRAKTIRILSNPRSKAMDIVRPGHVLGLVARPGGLLERQGHTEAAVDLSRLAGKSPAGVLCEIVGRSGGMARGREMLELSRELGLKIVAISDLVRYLRKHPLPKIIPVSVSRVSSSTLPTPFGTFSITAYRSLEGREHAALVLGKPNKKALVRIHSQCLTGDALFSLRCDCGEQLKEAMRRIAKEKSGVIVYTSQEGRGIGLGNKIQAYALQDKGLDTVQANHALGFSADLRTYEAAAEILESLGVKKIRLMTNNPDKIKQLSFCGVEIVERVPLEIQPNGANARYLKTKKRKLGHRLTKV